MSFEGLFQTKLFYDSVKGQHSGPASPGLADGLASAPTQEDTALVVLCQPC